MDLVGVHSHKLDHISARLQLEELPVAENEGVVFVLLAVQQVDVLPFTVDDEVLRTAGVLYRNGSAAYGRMQPASSGGTVKLRERTNSVRTIAAELAAAFDAKTNHQLLYRRMGICANNITADDGVIQLDLFTDYDALERERKIQAAMLEVRAKYGSNALFTGKNMVEGATTLERNMQIGGHRA